MINIMLYILHMYPLFEVLTSYAFCSVNDNNGMTSFGFGYCYGQFLPLYPLIFPMTCTYSCLVGLTHNITIVKPLISIINVCFSTELLRGISSESVEIGLWFKKSKFLN